MKMGFQRLDRDVRIQEILDDKYSHSKYGVI